MEVLQKRIYLVEIADSAQFGVLMREQFLEMVGAHQTRQSTHVWMSLQAALLSYGTVSKFLFPVNQGRIAQARGEALRKELGILDTSPLKNRDARNAVEHFDERLDRCLESPQAGILQAVFANRADYAFLNPDRWIVRRAYIANEDIFVTEGKQVGSRVEMPLTEIFRELELVYAVADDLLMTKYRLQ